MTAILESLARFGDLVLVVLGFSLIIVIHEAGHFLAARWAGIRVLAFAVGFGPAIVSFRRGLGWRRGSSEPEYKRAENEGRLAAGVSTTEYRLNILPFGGYVKMLGQDDINPTARSHEPDSYQSCVPWKRMIVISAGVVANIITAAALFVAVFMIGLKTEPAKVGLVEAGSPAATTVARNAAALGVTDVGLKSGDEIVQIDGEEPLSFNDVVLASAMARRGRTVEISVRRRGVDGVLHFPIMPVEDRVTKLLFIGIRPAESARLRTTPRVEERVRFMQVMAERGLPGVEPGMTLKSIGGKPVESLGQVFKAVDESGGQTLPVVFESEDGREVRLALPSDPRMMRSMMLVGKDEAIEARHLLGLMPVMAVEDVTKDSGGYKVGMRPGDVFSRLGALEWPSFAAGISEVRAHRGKDIRVTVVRKDSDGRWVEKDLGDVPVSRDGKIGFLPFDSSARGAWVGTPYTWTEDAWNTPQIAAGSRIVGVNGQATATMRDVRRALFEIARAGEGERVATLSVESPLQAADGGRWVQEIDWPLNAAAVTALTTSPWEPALEINQFEPEQVVLKADGPVHAIKMGVSETHRVMLTTYVTFARLFQGTIKVSHLKGPVGIAHVGTLLAERGWVWLLFFMAIISVNLAVINFLPIPIADGGHFVFLLYEQITGKPVSAAVQNVAAIAGLVLLAAVFLIVTFNDIQNLFRG